MIAVWVKNIIVDSVVSINFGELGLNQCLTLLSCTNLWKVFSSWFETCMYVYVSIERKCNSI